MASISGPSRETSAVKTHYEILEISPAVTRQEIKDAYKRLAILKHPDKNLGDTASACIAFQQLQTTYETLSEPTLRTNTTPLFFVPPPKTQDDAIDHHHEQRQHDRAQSNQHPRNGPSHRNPASHTKTMPKDPPGPVAHGTKTPSETA